MENVQSSRQLAPIAAEPGLVNSVVYCAGRKLVDIPIEDAGEWACRPGHVVEKDLYQRIIFKRYILCREPKTDTEKKKDEV